MLGKFNTSYHTRNILAQAKFETKTILKSPKLTGLFSFNNYVYRKGGYIILC